MNPETLGRQMLVAVKGYVGRAVSVLALRIDDLDRRLKEIPAGPEGKQGERGADGPKGSIGDTGKAGLDGKNGIDGKDGLPGIHGRDGSNGKDGQDGRDAIQIEPLNAIDETKTYKRGTWARYNGGLVRAVRETDAVMDGDIFTAGWSVMWDGTAAVVFVQSQVDPRECEVISVLTSGTRFSSKFYFPYPLHRGVFSASKEYVQGDLVVHDNQLWSCMTARTQAVPGKSPDWLLSVRRGADGKPGKDGKGEKGDPGMPGRDLRYQ